MTQQGPELHRQNDPETKVGKGMWAIAWIMGLVLLTLFFGDVLEKQQNPNQSPTSYRDGNVIEVVLERNRFGHYVTSGTINDYPVVFMLDTGATGVAIPEEVANIIGLEKGMEYSTYTANGIGKGYRTRIDSLSFGDIKVTDLNAGIAPNMPGGQVLLGMSVLKKLEFTQRGNKLILRQYQ